MLIVLKLSFAGKIKSSFSPEQLLNAYSPINSIVDGKCNPPFNLVQPSKAFLPINLRVSWIFVLKSIFVFNALQALNALSPIYFNDEGNDKAAVSPDVKPVQPSNAESPIIDKFVSFTLSLAFSKTSDVKDLQSLNALPPIDLIDAGIVIFPFKLVLLANALPQIATNS